MPLRISRMTSLSRKVNQSPRARPSINPLMTSTGISQIAVKQTTAAVTGPLPAPPRTDPPRRRPMKSTVAVSHLPCRQSMSARRKCWRMLVPALGSSNIATRLAATVTKSTVGPLSEHHPSARATSNGRLRNSSSSSSSNSLSREHLTILLLATRAPWSTLSDMPQPRLFKKHRMYEPSMSRGSTLSKSCFQMCVATTTTTSSRTQPALMAKKTSNSMPLVSQPSATTPLLRLESSSTPRQ